MRSVIATVLWSGKLHEALKPKRKNIKTVPNHRRSYAKSFERIWSNFSSLDPATRSATQLQFNDLFSQEQEDFSRSFDCKLGQPTTRESLMQSINRRMSHKSCSMTINKMRFHESSKIVVNFVFVYFPSLL